MVEAAKAVHLVLYLGPGCAYAELEPAARQVIHRHRELGEQRRIAVRVAGHKASDSSPLGGLSHRGLQRPTFKDRAVRSTIADGGEVIEVPDVVEPRLVRDLPDAT